MFDIFCVLFLLHVLLLVFSWCNDWALLLLKYSSLASDRVARMIRFIVSVIIYFVTHVRCMGFLYSCCIWHCMFASLIIGVGNQVMISVVGHPCPVSLLQSHIQPKEFSSSPRGSRPQAKPKVSVWHLCQVIWSTCGTAESYEPSFRVETFPMSVVSEDLSK